MGREKDFQHNRHPLFDFLGAGKTTLIKKLIKESFAGQKVVLIENEFGEIGIDGGFLKESGIQINELNAGCRAPRAGSGQFPARSPARHHTG